MKKVIYITFMFVSFCILIVFAYVLMGAISGMSFDKIKPYLIYYLIMGTISTISYYWNINISQKEENKKYSRLLTIFGLFYSPFYSIRVITRGLL